ncbi:MAG: type II CRISPR RNA-guided endonuclease Cas9 [Lachnospiraceae bacterium]|nr:type II CRISPR RNA-guided endonuclease Cas9 [Lachnospiraceae bacterium]
MYYMGLDLGTSSVGWAVTDEKYNIVRKKGKDIWGVRLFDEAKTANDRRTNRISRRRRAREVARIGTLKDFFSEAIEEVDPGFYQRVEESKYHEEDKRGEGKDAIFHDVGFTDKEYYAQYPTIAHLQKELILSKDKHDVRLVYLAILNLFKHRGHFLNAGLGDVETDAVTLYSELQRIAVDEFGISFSGEYQKQEIDKIVNNRAISKRERAEQLAALWNIAPSKEKREYEIIKMLCGLSGKIANIFEEGLLTGETGKLQVSFRDARYDEKLGTISECGISSVMDLIDTAKKLHDCWLLNEIMKGQPYLCFARVSSYEKHREDLRRLKAVIQKYAPEEYEYCFRTMKNDNYSGYVGSVNCKKIKARRNRKASSEEFFKYLRRILADMPEDEEVQYLQQELENESLLPKQLTADNGVIPNQAHATELKAILKNAQEYLPFLKKKDETGLTISDKIVQLFTFQIPYYVGPLHINSGEESNKWVVRKEGGKVFPWNLEQKVDLQQTREQFVMRMVRHCTYVAGESALPKGSLLYEKFMVLNELNVLRINGERISVEDKQNIFNQFFLKGKKVSRKKILSYFQSQGVIGENDADLLSGMEEGFASSLTSYGRFKDVVGDAINTWDYQQMAEQIIFWGTVYSGDRKLLSQLITEKYGPESSNALLTKEQIKRISGFKWQDWGRLSRQFLEMEGCEKETGEVRTLISALWETNSNLMELLSDAYTYSDRLAEKSEKKDKLLAEVCSEDLEEYYFSAPVKRMIWQTLLIMKEVGQVMGENPGRVFIEMPRTDGEKGVRTTSRKRKFEELYKQCKKDERDWQAEISLHSEGEFRSKKLYLYYLQKGRCMYSGEPIALEDLFNDNLYDIDHVYPRHYVKDDSLDNNLVLVKKQINAHKRDNFPLEREIQGKQHAFWRSLLDTGFLSKEKYNRLTRTWQFSDEELASFINRQIVETGQATKAVAHLLEEMLPGTEVVYVKAGNVSEFRHQFDVLKARSVNDLHHAKDAYLNIVVGNVYYTKFTRNPLLFIQQNGKNRPYHMDKVFLYDVQRNGTTAWTAGNQGSIVTVKEMMNKNTPLVTRKVYEMHGGIANQNLCSAKEAKPEIYLPAKVRDRRLKDVTKYGGYEKVTGAYYFLVEHMRKGKKIRTLEVVPLYLKEQLSDINNLTVYCEQRLRLEQPRVILYKIRFKTLIKRNGFLLRLSGRTDNWITVDNAVQLCIGKHWENYIRHLENFLISGKEYDNREIVTNRANIELYQLLLEKHTQTIYRERPHSIAQKMIDAKDKFKSLNLIEQASSLMELLKATQCTNLPIDDKATGIKTSRMKINNDITRADTFLLIYESVTGIYTREMDLKAL